MRNIVFSILVSLLSVAAAAQDDGQQSYVDSLQAENEALASRLQTIEDEQAYKKIWGRRKYWNIGYGWGTLNNVDFGEKYDSEMGFSLSRGRVIYVHKKPVAGMLKFGIDLGLDVSYSKYKEKDRGAYDRSLYVDDEEDESLGLHSIDVGLAVGPSVTINPVSKLKVKAFFHVVPSYSMLIVEDDAHHSYKTAFTYGGEVTWSRVGIGIEGYTGTAKYKSVMDETMDNLDDSYSEWDDYIPKGKTKFRTSGFRLYLTIKL